DASITRTSNGRGRVTRLTLAELNRHDYSTWHGEKVLREKGLGDKGPREKGPREKGRRERTRVAADEPDDLAGATVDDGILTLDRLLTLARGSGRPLRLLIETKHPSRYGGDVERRLVDLLARHGLTTGTSDSGVSVTVMSFSI